LEIFSANAFSRLGREYKFFVLSGLRQFYFCEKSSIIFTLKLLFKRPKGYTLIGSGSVFGLMLLPIVCAVQPDALSGNKNIAIFS